MLTRTKTNLVIVMFDDDGGRKYLCDDYFGTGQDMWAWTRQITEGTRFDSLVDATRAMDKVITWFNTRTTRRVAFDIFDTFTMKPVPLG